MPLDQEPAIAVCEFDALAQLAPQNDQLMLERGIIGLKPDLRLEWRGQDGENETEQPDHSTSLGDSITSSTRIRFSVHSRGTPRWPGGSCRLSLRRSAGGVDTGLDPASKEGNMKSRAGGRASCPHEHSDMRDR